MNRTPSVPKKPMCLPKGGTPRRAGTWLASLGALAIAVLSGATHAQSAPANDRCSNAIRFDPSAGGVTIIGTTVNAANDGNTTCGASTGSADVWYIYSARSTGLVTVDTCGSAFDTVLSVHTGCPGTVANTLVCNDNAATGDCAGGLTSSVTFNAVRQNSYLIRVSGVQGASGPFILRAAPGSVVVTPPPSNDACSGARPIGYGDHSYTTIGAVQDGPGGPATDCIGSFRKDVWFRFTACTTGLVSAYTCFDTPWDTVVGVYYDNCSYLSPLACNDNECGLQSVARFNATAGGSYLIRVGVSPNAVYHGAGTLRVLGPACPPPPPPPPSVPANNNCAAATTIPAISAADGITTVYGTTINATNDGSASCGSSSTSPDVWYRFEAKGSGPVTIDTCGSTYNTVLSVHTGCPGTVNNSLACNDNAGTGGCAGSSTSSVTFNAIDRASYWIRVAGFRGYTGTFTLRCARSANALNEPPSNDLCSNAPLVTYGAHPYNTIGAGTDGPPGEMGDCYYGMQNDVWFRFTACTTGVVTAGTCANTIWDSVMSVYTGSCSAPTLIACNDDGCGTQSRVSFPATAGATYLIRVGVNPTSPYRGPGVLTISGPACPPPPPPAPANNNCSAATSIGIIPSDGTLTTINGTTINATNDGATSCGASNSSPDVWYTFHSPISGVVNIDTCGSGFDTVLSVHSTCTNTLVCSDNATYGPCPGGGASFLALSVANHGMYKIRVSGNNNASGPFTLHLSYSMALVGGPEACPCDWDRDGSLTTADFYAFLNDFMSGTADFNSSGDVNSQDFFDYLGCFLTAPGLCGS